MIDRLKKIAFKQVVRKEWMDRTLELVCADVPENEIREYLDGYISTQQPRGGEGQKRNKVTYGISIRMLSCWFKKNFDLEDFRNALIEEAKKTDRTNWLPLHMAIITASYPFWFQTCSIVGKLFSYQDTISSSQIYDKIISIYGDKKAIRRNTQYVIQTMVSWGMISNSEKRKGVYERTPKFEIKESKMQALLFESVLLANASGRMIYEDIYRSPGLFKFQFDYLPSRMVEHLCNGRVQLVNYGMTTEYLCLKNQNT